MPRYDYFCPACREQFETLAGVNERFVRHVCGSQAERRPFSGVPYLKGETVARDIPDPIYRQEQEKRDFNQRWGDSSRSVELMRKHMYVDEKGNKMIDAPAINREGE